MNNTMITVDEMKSTSQITCSLEGMWDLNAKVKKRFEIIHIPLWKNRNVLSQDNILNGAKDVRQMLLTWQHRCAYIRQFLVYLRIWVDCICAGPGEDSREIVLTRMFIAVKK